MKKQDLKYSFGVRTEGVTNKTKTPGPGAYDFLNKSTYLEKVKGAAITTDKKIGNILNKT